MGRSADDRIEERAEPAKPPEFPRYMMIVDGKTKFLPMSEAGVKYDSGWERVELGQLVLEADFSARLITPDEERQIQEIADRHSDSK